MLISNSLRSSWPHNYSNSNTVRRWFDGSLDTLLFHTYQHLSTTNNWALSTLCFYVFLFLSFSRITLIHALIYIYSLYFFSLIPPSLPHVRHACPSWYTVSCSRRNYLCRSFSRLFLFFVPAQYSTPLNKLEIFKKRTFCLYFWS